MVALSSHRHNLAGASAPRMAIVRGDSVAGRKRRADAPECIHERLQIPGTGFPEHGREGIVIVVANDVADTANSGAPCLPAATSPRTTLTEQ